MAVRPYTMIESDFMRAQGVVVVQWQLNQTDTGEPISLADYQDKSVQVSGTFGTGGSVQIEGANNPNSIVYSTLRDPQGSLITFTSAGLRAILENTFFVRPNCTAGDGTTNLLVTVVAAKKRG